MSAKTAARVLVDCLLAQGVTTAFGVPGESYLAVLDALIDSGIRMVPNRHEGGAAFMAEAWGKLTGEPGICFVTRGPGATNASIGVHTAMQDSAPMVLFIGQIETGGREREVFQEVDYRAFFGPIAKWATEIDRADRVPEILARAFAVARSGRPGPVVVALPEDMLVQETEAQAGPAIQVPKAAPAAEDLDAVREMLAAARKPLVLAGGGGWGEPARAGLRAFAEANALPVLTVWRYTDLLDNDSPSFVGTAGLGKTASVRQLMLEADLIIALGIRFGEMTTDNYELYPPPRMTARLVHAHPSDLELNKIYTADLPIHSHPDRLLPALAALRVDPGPWAERTAAARAAWHAELDTPPRPDGVDMGAVTRHLAEVLPRDAILTNGAGNFSIWPNKHFPFSGGRRLLAPQSGAMGYGLPAAVAAKIARPAATVVCFAGDGDFQMNGNELATAAQTGAAIVVLLVNNGGYGTIRMHQERSYPGRVSFTELTNPDFAAMARSYGMLGERVERTEDFAAAFVRAVAAPGGALLDLAVDMEALTPRATLSAIREAALARVEA